MKPFEVSTHSFIIKIWSEETNNKSGQIVWRGHITHVPSGNRGYIKDLHEIILFINPYIEDMGVNLELKWQVLRWLTKMKMILTNKN